MVSKQRLLWWRKSEQISADHHKSKYSWQMVCSRRSPLLRTHLMPTVVPPYKELDRVWHHTLLSAYCDTGEHRLNRFLMRVYLNSFARITKKKIIILFAFVLIGLSARSDVWEFCVSNVRGHITLMLLCWENNSASGLGVKHEIWSFVFRDLFATTGHKYLVPEFKVKENSKSPHIINLRTMIRLQSALAKFTKPQSSASSLYNIVARPLNIGRGHGKRKMKSPPKPSQSRMAWPTVTYFTIIAVFSSMVAFNTLHGLHLPPKTKWQIRGRIIRGGVDLLILYCFILSIDLDLILDLLAVERDKPWIT